MGVYFRGKYFWFSMQHQGRRIQGSLKTNNRRVAEERYVKRYSEIIDDEYFEKKKLKRITFNEMTTKYLQEHAKQRDPRTVKTLLLFFSGYTLYQITARFIAEYKAMRLKKVKPATVYQDLALLRRMFNVAIKEWEWLKENPVSKLSFSVGNRNARDRWLTSEEEGELLKAATNPKWLKTLLMTALHTGMRRGEILNLKWQDVSLQRKLITIIRSKNGDKRFVPMSNTLYDILDAIKLRDISGRIFPISGSSLRQAFDMTVAKAGIEDFRFHDLRHTFATRLIQNGVDLYKVKELLGHRTIAVTMRYAHHYTESLRLSIETLDLLQYATVKNPVVKEAEKILKNQ